MTSHCWASQQWHPCTRAIVTGVEDFGLFAQGIEVPAEGLVQIIDLPPDDYDYDPRAHSLSGRRGNLFRLGDLVLVEIAHVDMDARTLSLKVIEKLGRTLADDLPQRR